MDCNSGGQVTFLVVQGQRAEKRCRPGPCRQSGENGRLRTMPVGCRSCQHSSEGKLVWLAAVNELKSVTVGEEDSLDCEKGIVVVATNGR